MALQGMIVETPTRERRPGQPTKLTFETQTALVGLLSQGVSVKDACAGVGISQGAYYDWLERAEDDPENNALYVQFSQAVTRARENAKRTAIAAVYSSLVPRIQTTRTTEVITDQRADDEGKVYTHTHTVARTTHADVLPDGRIGIEYLKRRSPDEWSDKLQINVKLEVVLDAVKVLNDVGADPTDYFKTTIELVRQFAALGVDANAFLRGALERAQTQALTAGSTADNEGG